MGWGVGLWRSADRNPHHHPDPDGGGGATPPGHGGGFEPPLRRCFLRGRHQLGVAPAIGWAVARGPAVLVHNDPQVDVVLDRESRNRDRRADDELRGGDPLGLRREGLPAALGLGGEGQDESEDCGDDESEFLHFEPPEKVVFVNT